MKESLLAAFKWSLGITAIMAVVISVERVCKSVDGFTAEWRRFNDLDTLKIPAGRKHGKP